MASGAAEPKHVPPETEPLPAWLAAAPEPEPGEPEAPAWAPMASAKPARPAAEAAKPDSTPQRPKPAKPKAPRKRPVRPSRLRSGEEPEIVLALARQRLAENNFGESFDVYSELIHSSGMLEDVIADLEAANQKNPGMPELLRTLGDAYMRNNQLRRALDTYQQALQQL
jgi:tetratricopeptide (TPR) repeat protein